MLGHARQQRVAARGEQAQERRLDRVGREEVGGDVALEVVDRRERQPPRGGQPLAVATPIEQRADQARALGDRDQLGVVERGAGARSASSTTALTSSRWWREAISGTTPP